MARFGIESMHGMRDAENNDRLLGITGLGENLGRITGLKNLIGPMRTLIWKRNLFSEFAFVERIPKNLDF